MKHTLLRSAVLFCLTLGFATSVFAQSSASSSGGGSSYDLSFPLSMPRSNNLTLIQPLDDTTTSLPAMNGIDMVFAYFNLSWPWLLGTAAGLAVLQGVVAGVQIMYSGSPDKVDEGKTRFMWAVGGMILLGLAGVILRSLNAIFYT